MFMNRTEVCLAALAVAIVLWFLKKAPKPHAVAAFLAVAGLVTGAVGGWLPRVVLWLSHWLTLGEGKLVNLLFGQTDPGFVLSVIAAVIVGLVVHDLWPKHTAKRRTVILAAVAPVLMLAAGGQWAAAVNGSGGSALSAGPASITRTIPVSTSQGGESWTR